MQNYLKTYFKIKSSQENVNIILEDIIEKELEAKQRIRCRGKVMDFERTGKDELVIGINATWSPIIQCVDRFVNHYIPNRDDYRILFVSDDTEKGVHITNDPEMKDHIIVEEEDFINICDLPEEWEDLQCLFMEPGWVEYDMDTVLDSIRMAIGDQKYKDVVRGKKGQDLLDALTEETNRKLSEITDEDCSIKLSFYTFCEDYRI